MRGTGQYFEANAYHENSEAKWIHVQYLSRCLIKMTFLKDF